MVIAVQSPRTISLSTLDGLSLVEVTAEVAARLDDCVAARALQFPLAQLCACACAFAISVSPTKSFDDS
jgi:hypothetical protein